MQTGYKLFVISISTLFFFLISNTVSYSQAFWEGYHSPEEANEYLLETAENHSGITRVHTLAQSPGGRELLVLEIGPEVNSDEKNLPAILVVANMEGVIPITTEASLKLIELIIEENAAEDKTWYILPNGNPDAAVRFFQSPLRKDVRNEFPVNDDKDDQVGEDGPEDINNDGFVTQMRYEHPNGEWLPVEGEPRLMRRSDRTKGERGIYKIHSEGIDNDGDGLINEDPPGGINVNRNFPHLFREFTATGGAWPGSTPEARGMFEFVFSHPEIAMTFSLGETNFALQPPRGGRQGTADFQNIQIPERFADQIGADPDATYTMDEVIQLVEPLAPPGFEITESVVASFLGLGAVVNPMQDDLAFYNELAERYKEYLEEQGLSTDRIDPAPAKDGSFELWSYYHLGIPTFSMDFWTLPEFKESDDEDSGLTPEKIGEMSNEEFVALGEETIGQFLEEVGAPDQFSAAQVISMVEGGMLTTTRIAEMLGQMPAGASAEAGEASSEDKALIAWVDDVLNGEGFIEWSEFDHPDLGTVEIGGPVPFVKNTPPYAMVDSLLSAQVPWIVTLSKKIARLNILETDSEYVGGGLYRVTAWIENENYLPFPTAMGVRNQNPKPAEIFLQANGLDFIEGRERTLLESLGGLEAKKFTWLVRSPETTTLQLRVETTHAWSDHSQIDLGGLR